MALITAVLTVAALLAASSHALAQTAVSLDKESYLANNLLRVTVTIPDGTTLSKPRFHFIRDDQPLPKDSSPKWIQFPPMTATQTLTLRGPDEVNRDEAANYWLLLYDGKQMAARIPFQLMGWELWLQLEYNRVNAPGFVAGDVVDETPPGESPRPAPAPEVSSPAATTSGSATSRAITSPRNHLRVDVTREVRLGDRLEITVTAPAAAARDSLSLKWADTAGLPFDLKELAPSAGDLGPAVEVPSGAKTRTVSILAPTLQPGQYDLLLVRGSELLDAVTVAVNEHSIQELRQ